MPLWRIRYEKIETLCMLKKSYTEQKKIEILLLFIVLLVIHKGNQRVFRRIIEHIFLKVLCYAEQALN